MIGIGSDVGEIDTTVSKWSQVEQWKTYAQTALDDQSANAYDAFVYFINAKKELLKGMGYSRVHIWESVDNLNPAVTSIDRDILIQLYVAHSPLEYLDGGYDVWNFYNVLTYYIVGGRHVTPEAITENWTLYTYREVDYSGSRVYRREFVGGGICVWADKAWAETEGEVIANVIDLIQAQSAKFAITA